MSKQIRQAETKACSVHSTEVARANWRDYYYGQLQLPGYLLGIRDRTRKM